MDFWASVAKDASAKSAGQRLQCVGDTNARPELEDLLRVSQRIGTALGAGFYVAAKAATP